MHKSYIFSKLRAFYFGILTIAFCPQCSCLFYIITATCDCNGHGNCETIETQYETYFPSIVTESYALWDHNKTTSCICDTGKFILLQCTVFVLPVIVQMTWKVVFFSSSSNICSLLIQIIILRVVVFCAHLYCFIFSGYTGSSCSERKKYLFFAVILLHCMRLIDQ